MENPHRPFLSLSASSSEEMVEAFGARWTVEQCFEEAKGEVGLDEYEVRSWHGWHRHVTLSMLALSFLTVLRVHDQEGYCLLAHLEWWRAYYHFVRPHVSLRVTLEQPREWA
jgi:transposase InsO family protein